MIEKILSLRDKITGTGRLRVTLNNLENNLESLTKISDALRSDIQKFSTYSSGGIIPLGESELIVKIFNDLIMYLDPRDLAVVPHLALERIWEKDTTIAWNNVLDEHKPSVVFDVGANFGYFGLLAAQRLKLVKTNKVVMFEANPHLIPYIDKTLAVNWLKEIAITENLAISANEGISTLNILKDYTGSSSLHSQKKLGSYLSHKMNILVAESVDISTTSIDIYCKNHLIDSIDLLKMDIEGLEDKAYEGMRRIIKKSPHMIIFIEFTAAGYDKPETFFKQIKSDFNYIYTIGEDGTLIDKSGKDYNEVITEDDLAMLVIAKINLTKQ